MNFEKISQYRDSKEKVPVVAEKQHEQPEMPSLVCPENPSEKRYNGVLATMRKMKAIQQFLNIMRAGSMVIGMADPAFAENEQMPTKHIEKETKMYKLMTDHLGIDPEIFNQTCSSVEMQRDIGTECKYIIHIGDVHGDESLDDSQSKEIKKIRQEVVDVQKKLVKLYGQFMKEGSAAPIFKEGLFVDMQENYNDATNQLSAIRSRISSLDLSNESIDELEKKKNILMQDNDSSRKFRDYIAYDLKDKIKEFIQVEDGLKLSPESKNKLQVLRKWSNETNLGPSDTLYYYGIETMALNGDVQLLPTEANSIFDSSEDETENLKKISSSIDDFRDRMSQIHGSEHKYHDLSSEEKKEVYQLTESYKKAKAAFDEANQTPREAFALEVIRNTANQFTENYIPLVYGAAHDFGPEHNKMMEIKKQSGQQDIGLIKCKFSDI